jgi:pimeloyl-ACP methyl ester carboxylesterase
MIEIERSFHSDGISLSGAFYLPDPDVDRRAPLVVPCSGFTGLRSIHPERFARSLTARGYACFAFDYRGFPPSGGEPGRVLVEEQVRDIRNAAAFAVSDPEHGADRVVLLGWGMAGGMVLPATRNLPSVCGLVCVNGFYDALRVQRAVRSAEDCESFFAWLQEERREATRSSERRRTDPFWIYPLDPVSKGYVDSVLRAVPGYEADTVHTAFADSLLDFSPERDLGHLSELPVLIAHGDQNALHPTGEARSLFERYPGPKELFWIEGGGHTEWMDDDDNRYKRLAGRIADWLDAL